MSIHRKKPWPPPEFRLETLETRVLFSADSPLSALGALPPAAPLESHVEAKVSSNDAVVVQSDTSRVVETAFRELVIIDAGVPDLDALLADFENRGADAPKVIVLEAGQDPLASLGRILTGEQELNAVHLISHGEDGALELGGQRITVLDLLARAHEIAGWRNAFADDADLLLYGCNVAGSAEGQAFVDTLARLSGADIAASHDITGASAKGGNWALEYRNGQVQGEVAFSQQLQEDYIASFATFTVDNLNDSGAGSFRQAIIDSNASGTSDLIQFSVAGTIDVLSELPAITNSVSIDATTMPGYAGSPLITLSGSSASPGVDGISFIAGSDTSEIKGLAIINFTGNGIHLDDTTGVVIESNYIGTGGITDQGNSFHGILLSNSANNVIGGAGAGNIISGNGNGGLVLSGSGTTSNRVAGNIIGLDISGTIGIGNGTVGLSLLNGASSNTIGGTIAGSENVVSGNGNNGIRINASSNNVVLGNYIGTNATGTGAVANGNDGVQLTSGASNNTIGGTTTAERNIISGNTDDGIVIEVSGTTANIVSGNYIGTDVSGTLDIDNRSNGVQIRNGASGNSIGSGVPGGGNLISGNNKNGIQIKDAVTTGNMILGNMIGLASDGTSALGNGIHGIFIEDAPGNIIGGSSTDERNIISGNDSAGILIRGTSAQLNIVSGNYIGTNIDGTASVTNIGAGVQVFAGANDNDIGLASAGGGNVISGNGSQGVHLDESSNNRVHGNLIGLASDGSTALGNTGIGVLLTNAATGNKIGGSMAGERNIVSGNSKDGVVLADTGTTLNEIAGNYIGTSTSGMASVGNDGGAVSIVNGASNNRIGSGIANGGNLLSGNTLSAIYLSGDNTTANSILGNMIGLASDGSSLLPNGGTGIFVDNAPANTIGGSSSAERNVISGNAHMGVVINGSNATLNVVTGNFIGTDFSGSLARGNGSHGIAIRAGANLNTIGGGASGEGNVISSNGQDGINIQELGSDGNAILGNFIGTDASGIDDLGNSRNGITLFDGPQNTHIGQSGTNEGNVIAGNDGYGILINGDGLATTTANVIKANVIGLDSTGSSVLTNALGGISITNGANANTIGGDGTAGEGNVVSGHAGAVGISVDGLLSSENVIVGNLVGTDDTGRFAFANTIGILNQNSPGTIIGGTGSGEGNTVSGNAGSGVVIDGAGSTEIFVYGNFIGVTLTGTAALGNGGAGLNVSGGSTRVTIGGTVSGSRNVIAANGSHGVYIENSDTVSLIGNHIGTGSTSAETLGNTLDGVHLSDSKNSLIGGTETASSNRIVHNGGIGVAVTGASSGSNAILGNVIFGNTSLGIDVGADGVTPNDTGVLDADSGPNGLQNTPDLFRVGTDESSTITILGSINSEASSDYRIEFFATTAADPENAGEAERYLGFISVTSDNDGLASFSTTLSASVTEGEFITATATDDLGSGNYGNSSEFSTNVVARELNERPVVSQLSGISSAENQTAVETVIATDANGDALSYSIQGGDDALQFGVNTNSGELSFNSAPDFETYTDDDLNGIYEVIVRVTDEYGATDDHIFSVTVTDVDEDSVVFGTFIGAVTEGNVGDAIEATSGSLSISDPDTGDSPTFNNVASTNGDNAYGTFELTSGTWTYTLDQNAVQDLDAGDSVVDTITYIATDGSSQQITVTITGTDDASVISGAVASAVAEGDLNDSPKTTSGTISISDVDGDDLPSFADVASINGDNAYGSFELTGGTWTYTLNQSAVQHLDSGDSVFDTIIYTATDGSTQQITVTIAGTVDASVINGTVTGAVNEGDVGDSPETATGTISISDVDGGDSPSFADVASTNGDNAYGTFELTGGTWTYTLDQGAVQHLDSGDSVFDTIIYTATDGSTQQITVTIAGDCGCIGDQRCRCWCGE